MSLPFLKKQNVAGLIISHRKPDGGKEEEKTEGQEDHGLMSCSDEILRAISNKDSSALASALRSAFQILDSEPHNEEGSHTNEDYDSQNEKAARED